MTLKLTLLPVILLAAGILNAVVAVMAFQRSRRRGGAPLALLMAALAIWQLATSLELAAVSAVDKVLWSKFSYIGIVSVPVLFLYFAMQYTYYDRWMTRGRVALLGIIPLITLAAAASNELHWLLWTGYSYNPLLDVMTYGHGPVFWLYLAYAYIVLGAGSALLVISSVRFRKIYRSQFFVILISLAIAWGGNIVYATGLIPLAGVDPTPWTFGLAGVLFLWGILRLDLFDIVPAARQEALEKMHDGLVIVDDHNRIIDFNPAARVILLKAMGEVPDATASRLFGRSLTAVLSSAPNIAARLRGSTQTFGAITLGIDGDQRIFDVQVSPLAGYQHKVIGRAVLLHDVTEHHYMAESESRARQVAEALQEIGMSVTSTLNFDRVLDQILAYLRRLVAVDSCNILLLEGGALRIAAVNGLDPEAMVGFSIPFTDEYPNKQIIETRQVVNLPDCQAVYEVFARPPHNRIRSWMGAPLIVKNQVIGTLNLDSEEPDHFTAEDERVVMAFATQAAVAIENSRLFTEARRSAVEQEVLNEIFHTISMKLELPELLEVVQKQVRRFIDFDMFLVATYLPVSDDWEAFYMTGGQEAFVQSVVKPTGGLTGYIIHTRQPLLLGSLSELENLMQHTGALNIGPPPRSFMGVPLVVADKMVGAMVAEHHSKEQAFRADDLRLFGMIGTQVAIAAENARLFAEIKAMAITDSLTGLHTRRHFYAQADKALLHAVRYCEPFSALMIDLDHFKAINDSYGHASGDQVLQTVARLCREALRDADIIGRYGGEEIAVVMPQTRTEQACQVAERLRRIISGYSFGLPVTISLGIAAINSTCKTLDLLLDHADRAMYAAKQAGRNQYRVYGEEVIQR